jgi:hypothetical protein
VATPPVGRHGIVSVNEEKPRKLPQLECHPLSSMRVKIELLTPLFTNLGNNILLSRKITKFRSDPHSAPTVAFLEEKVRQLIRVS